VGLLRFLEALTDFALAVILARPEFEERSKSFTPDDRVAGEVEVADAVAQAFGHRNLQLDVARLLVVGIPKDLDLGNANLRVDVPPIEIPLHHAVGIFFELGFLVGSAAGDPGEHPLRLVVLHPLLEVTVAGRLVSDEIELSNLDLWPFAHEEG